MVFWAWRPPLVEALSCMRRSSQLGDRMEGLGFFRRISLQSTGVHHAPMWRRCVDCWLTTFNCHVLVNLQTWGAKNESSFFLNSNCSIPRVKFLPNCAGKLPSDPIYPGWRRVMLWIATSLVFTFQRLVRWVFDGCVWKRGTRGGAMRLFSDLFFRLKPGKKWPGTSRKYKNLWVWGRKMLRLTKREMERPLRGIARYGPSIRKRHKKNKIREKHEILRPRDMSPLRRSKNLKDLKCIGVNSLGESTLNGWDIHFVSWNLMGMQSYSTPDMGFLRQSKVADIFRLNVGVRSSSVYCSDCICFKS